MASSDVEDYRVEAGMFLHYKNNDLDYPGYKLFWKVRLPEDRSMALTFLETFRKKIEEGLNDGYK